jgi:hypothetical protein
MSKETLKHLNECRDFINGIVSPFGVEKKAALGGDGNDTQFEQSFSNLAHAFIKDKAPSLLDYEVGFQLMDRNEDNTKAVAIFGFKVGKQWLYTPIFFLNGDIKGTELLYIKDQDQFVPLKENWLNYILQRKPAVMGKNTDRNLQALGVLSPDLQAFSRPPAKFASAGGMEAGEAAFAYFATTNPLNDKKYSDVRDLPQFLKEAGKEVIVSLVKGMMAYPQAAEAVDAVYGLAEIKRAASVAKDKPLNLPADYKPVKPSEGVKMELTKADLSQIAPEKPKAETAKPPVAPKAEAAKPPAAPKVEAAKPPVANKAEEAENILQQGRQLREQTFNDLNKTMKDTKDRLAAEEAAKPWYERYYNTAEDFLGKNEYLQNIPKMFDSRLATLGIGAGIPLALWAAYNATKDDDEEETKKRIIINNYLNKAGEYAGSCSKNNEEMETKSPKARRGVLEAMNGHAEKKLIREKAGAIAILTMKTVVQRGVAFEPTDKEKENIITEGFSIRDERPETAVAYEVQTPLKLTSPTCTCVYDVLCRPTQFCKSLVIIAPVGPKGTANFATVIDLDDSKKKWTNIHPGNLWTRERAVQENEYKELFDSLPEAKPSALKSKGLYVLVGPNKEGTLPFEVVEEFEKDEAKTTLKVHFMDYSSADRPANLPKLQNANRDTYWGYGVDARPYGCGCSTMLHLTNKEGGRMRNMHNELYVPKGFKVIKLSEGSAGHADRSEKPAIEYGNQLDVQKAIFEKTAGIEVRHTGSSVSINDVQLEPKVAVVHLVRDWGLREKQARAILKNAAAKKVVSYRVSAPSWFELVKEAAPGDMIDPRMAPTTGAPPFPSPPSGLEQTMLGSVQSIYPQQEALPVMPSSVNLVGNEQVYDPRLPDPKTMAIGYKAQQTGQKEVFDTSMIGSLLKNVRSESIVDKFLGDLMKGMDRIGRILFSFYWHGEEMQDRYGKKDMPDLEESLRNAFEAVGDVVIFLKQKTVEPFPDEGFNPDLSGTAD